MKIFLMVLFFAVVLFAEVPHQDAPEDTTENEMAPEAFNEKFSPAWPDSLNVETIKPQLYPELDEDFRFHYGVVIVPNVENIELNPGGVVLVDPSVDLGMIQPPRTRIRILTENESRYKNFGPGIRFYSYPDPNQDDEKSEESRDQKEEK